MCPYTGAVEQQKESCRSGEGTARQLPLTSARSLRTGRREPVVPSAAPLPARMTLTIGGPLVAPCAVLPCGIEPSRTQSDIPPIASLTDILQASISAANPAPPPSSSSIGIVFFVRRNDALSLLADVPDDEPCTLPSSGVWRQGAYLLNLATNSTCGVWRNWSTGVTPSIL